MSFSKPPFPKGMHEYLVDHRAVASCLSCFYWREPTEKCGILGEENEHRPPAKVIVYGCPSWDGVPF